VNYLILDSEPSFNLNKTKVNAVNIERKTNLSKLNTSHNINKSSISNNFKDFSCSNCALIKGLSSLTPLSTISKYSNKTDFIYQCFRDLKKSQILTKVSYTAILRV